MALQPVVTITSPPGDQAVPATVGRRFEVVGNLSWPFGQPEVLEKRVIVEFGPGGDQVPASFIDSVKWQCMGTVSTSTPWLTDVQVTVSATVVYWTVSGNEEVHASTSLTVRLPQPIPPTVTLDAFPMPIVAAQMPVEFVFTGSAESALLPIQRVQYQVLPGAYAEFAHDAVNVSGDWSRFSVTLPLPPTAPGHELSLALIATDSAGAVGVSASQFAVRQDPPPVIPAGADLTFTGAPTTSSITSWTRLEPQCTDADMGLSSGARLLDAVWMLTRQWQMGEFQAEDAGTPIQARVRATTGMLSRRHAGELPADPVGGAAYDPTVTPLEVVVERRPMRAVNQGDARMLSFAVEAGLHFLRMLELRPLSQSYRDAVLARFALPHLAEEADADDATRRCMQVMAGRAPDGRQLADVLRTAGAAQLVADPALDIADADRAEVLQAATAWLTWYDSMYSEPDGADDDAWNPPRLEYAVSVAARLSASPQDEMTLSASEIDGPLDWSSFDVATPASLTPDDDGFTSLVEFAIPAPVTVPGVPAPRFWEMEDARLAYGLVPVGPTDLAHLMMIEYASNYGNDWFVVPFTLPVGSITRVDSLVVTDTFGVRSLLRPIGDRALPEPHFSLWQPSLSKPSPGAAFSTIARNRFFLPSTLGTSIDSAALEDVLFIRDEMANLAWAIERSIESPIEQPTQRYESPDAAPTAPNEATTSGALPRYVLASPVPPNWIPLLPVQVTNTAGQTLTRLKRGVLLQPDGPPKPPQTAHGEVLLAIGDQLFYDEEVPREGAQINRQRRLTRWVDGSTWVWTSLRRQVGYGEGASVLRFDQLLEPLNRQT
jgi:hypothetical protein